MWCAPLAIGLGAGLLDTTLRFADERQAEVEMTAVSFSGARLFSSQWTARFGVDLAVSLSSSWSKTVAPNTGDRTSYFAADARLGARAAWSLGRHIYPYLATRVFGGPVRWEWEGEDVRGSDVRHVQVAVGVAAQRGTLGLFGEWAVLGELGFNAGVSTAW